MTNSRRRTAGRAGAALVATLAVGLACAQPGEPALALAVALAVELAHAAAPAGAQVSAELGAIDTRLQLAPCVRAEAFPSPGQPAWGRTRIGLRCVEGPSRWRVFLPVTVQVRAPAVVAATTLPAGAVVQAAQLTLAEIDWAGGRSAPQGAVGSVAGRVLAHAVSAGQPVRDADLRPRQWFALGDTVRIEAAGAGFTAVSEGQALSPGHDGQPARVRTEGGKVLNGRAVGVNRVEVQL